MMEVLGRPPRSWLHAAPRRHQFFEARLTLFINLFEFEKQICSFLVANFTAIYNTISKPLEHHSNTGLTLF
jgi:hypothetical protein